MLLVVLATASLFPFVLFVIKYKGKRKPIVIFTLAYYVLSLCVLLHTFFAYFLQEKNIYPHLDVSWMYWFGIFVLFVDIAVFVLSIWKTKTCLYSMFVQVIGIIFLFVALGDVYNDNPGNLLKGTLFDFQTYLIYASILLCVLVLIEIGNLIYQFVKSKKIKTA